MTKPSKPVRTAVGQSSSPPAQDINDFAALVAEIIGTTSTAQSRSVQQDLMSEAIITQLIRLARVQMRALKAVHTSMKTIIETPNIDTERFLSVAVAKSGEALEMSEEIISRLESIWGNTDADSGE